MADFEERLRAAVTEQGDGFAPSDDLPDRIRSRVARRRRQQRLLTGGLAAGAATAALLVGVLVSRPGDDDGDRLETAGDRTTSTSTTTAEPTSTTEDTTPTTSTGPETTTSATTGTTTTATPSVTPSTTDQPRPPGQGPSTTSSSTTEADLRPADSPTPAAGACGNVAGAVIEITINPDVPSPRCVQARPDQSLRVRNAAGEPVDVSFGGRSARLADGASEAFPQPFGEYLAPGVHRVSASIYGGSGAEIYLGD